jgi:mono/diheme cytochrome c family protein
VRALLLLFVVGLIGAGVTVWYIRQHGLSARAEPSALETAIARRLRHLSIPADQRARPNPLQATAENIRDGMEHFADHCAVCHANTGVGDTPIGRGMYPHPPILREAGTQSLTDGEMFSIIQNGIRFTGMPAFADSGHTDKDSWKCVLFIRHLPQQTPQEIALMEKLNPKAPDEEPPPAPAGKAHGHVHGGKAKD